MIYESGYLLIGPIDLVCNRLGTPLDSYKTPLY